jgi:DNA-binding NarL/FixJ family response regulator
MEDEIRILIADDHPVVRQGLRQAIEADAALTVIAEAEDGQMAIQQIERLRPQVAVLDIDMPHTDGFAAARAIRTRQLATEIIFLTVHREEEFMNEALALGAKGYLLKETALSEIVACIKAVAGGQHYASQAMTAYLMKRAQRARMTAQSGTLADLSPTERHVLQLIAEYKTSREIADAMFISYRTVQTHRTNICQKLGLHGNHALMKFALLHKGEF